MSVHPWMALDIICEAVAREHAAGRPVPTAARVSVRQFVNWANKHHARVMTRAGRPTFEAATAWGVLSICADELVADGVVQYEHEGD